MNLSRVLATLFVTWPGANASIANSKPDEERSVVSGTENSTRDEAAILAASQEIFREVATKLSPSLVRIDTVGGAQAHDLQPRGNRARREGETPRSQDPFEESHGSEFLVASGSTTGVVYSTDGLIVTSSFNFIRDPLLISVTLADGRRLTADLVARDQVRKLALLKVDAQDLTVPVWTLPESVRVGDWIVALGLGFGGDHPSVTVGIISAKNRMAGFAVQTDAKLSPANYGGPLCDIHGRVVGLAVPMAQRPGELAGIEMYDAGIGFAVTSDHVAKIVGTLRTGTSIQRGWLGVQVDPATRSAVVIRNLADPSPMRSAGALPGDRIVAAGGRPIIHYGNLVQALNMTPAGQEVDLDLERDGVRWNLRVTLARSSELGPLPELAEPFDPAEPFPNQDLPEMPEPDDPGAPE